MKYEKTVEWNREFGRVGDWRVEKMGKTNHGKFGYLLSSVERSYLTVNPGPFATPEDRDEEILRDIQRRESARRSSL